MKNLSSLIVESLKTSFSITRKQNGKTYMRQDLQSFAYMLVNLATQHRDYYFTLTDLGGVFGCKTVNDVEEYLKTSKISDAVYKWLEQESTDGKHFHQVCVDDKPVDKKEFLKYFANVIVNTDLKKWIKKFEKS